MLPPDPRQRALLRATAFGAGLSLPVLVLAYLVRVEAPGMARLDDEAVAAATSFTREHSGLLHGLLAWQELLRPVWVNLAVALLCLQIWRRHGLGTRALWGIVTLLVAWVLQVGAKGLVHRARPAVEDALEHAPGSSFPSGHATNAAAAALTTTIVLWPLLGTRGRFAVVVVGGTVTLLTAADRVFLGVHHPSDVVAGILLGTAMVGASSLGYLGWRTQPRTEGLT
ncbi:phosphatase PAP2 family protein [Cellulomonas sp. URHD0024]|uniref:phosphatase PAP2 family protein n=1 Tax=Cellulomonas sp. URHD0024 TaxID=1302620 RepID=UPI000421C6A1|nr:phosphatase PAP2 family protein [Cellulomonas sp. URHD0024]